ncbi:MAG: hypothetical protein AAF371_15340 [Pseudomonadota bacterium]
MSERSEIDPLAAPPAGVPGAPVAASALDGRASPRRAVPDGIDGPGVTLRDVPIGALWQLTAWTDRLPTMAEAVATATGAAAPGPGRAAGKGGIVALRTEPLRWLVLAEPDGPFAAPSVDGHDGTLLDLGHARTRIEIAGPSRAPLMSRLSALDWRAGAFPAGSVATVVLGRVAVVALAREETIELLLPRSYAASLFDLVTETAISGGLEIA